MKLHRILILTLCAYTLISCGGAEERKAVYMEKAKSSIESGDFDKARIELKNVLQIDPKDAEAYYQLGVVQEQLKDYRKAFNNYLKAETLDPELLENQARIGRIYLLLANDKEKAQAKIDLILSKDSNNRYGLLLKAAMYVKNNDKKAAIAITEEILNNHKEYVEAITFLSALYMQDKQTEKAISLLDSGLKDNPGNKSITRVLARVLVSNKDYDRAEKIYKNFLEKSPDSKQSYNDLAAFYNLTGDKVKAEDTLRLSVKNDPTDDDRHLALVRYVIAVKSKDEGIKELEKLTAKYSGLGKLRIALGELNYLTGNKDAAIKAYKSAVDDFGEEETGVQALTALSLIYISDEDYKAAEEYAEKAISISPNDPKSNFIRARLALKNNDIEKAIISLRIVTKETPENIEAFILLAKSYELEGNSEQSRKTLNNALDKNKLNADGLLKLAQYHLLRDVALSEKIIDNYNSIRENDYDGLSVKSATLNQKGMAKEAFDIAVNLMATFPDKVNGYLQTIPYYKETKDIKNAVSTLEKGYLNVKDNRKILVLLTNLQLVEKRFDIVEKRLSAELKTSPEDNQLKILLAVTYLKNNKVDSAKPLLTEATNSNVKSEEAYLLLSEIYRVKNNSKSSKEILLKGKSNMAKSLKIPLRLASIYEVDKNYQDALTEYRELYAIAPDNLIIINNLTSMLSDYGDSENDLTLAKSLADKLKESGLPVFLDTVGWVSYKLGDYADAIQNFLQVVEKAPEISVFNYHLGMAYKMSGDHEKAKVYLKKSLSNDKGFKEEDLAKAALAEL